MITASKDLVNLALDAAATYTICLAGTELEIPIALRRSAGVTKIPIKLPKAELKIEAPSLPPTARVRIVAEDTGGGMHLRTCETQCDNVASNKVTTPDRRYYLWKRLTHPTIMSPLRIIGCNVV